MQKDKAPAIAIDNLRYFLFSSFKIPSPLYHAFILCRFTEQIVLSGMNKYTTLMPLTETGFCKEICHLRCPRIDFTGKIGAQAQ